MTIEELLDLCRRHGACRPATKWIEETFEESDPAHNAWRSCPYWEWLDWLTLQVGHLPGNAGYRKVTEVCNAAGELANTDHVPGTSVAQEPENRPTLARVYRRHVSWGDLRPVLEKHLERIREREACAGRRTTRSTSRPGASDE